MEMELMCDNLGEVFRLNVRKRMGQLDFTQSDLARQMGVTPSSVNQMLSGHREPGLGTLQSFAKALDTTASRLLDEKILAKSA